MWTGARVPQFRNRHRHVRVRLNKLIRNKGATDRGHHLGMTVHRSVDVGSPGNLATRIAEGVGKGQHPIVDEEAERPSLVMLELHPARKAQHRSAIGKALPTGQVSINIPTTIQSVSPVNFRLRPDIPNFMPVTGTQKQPVPAEFDRFREAIAGACGMQICFIDVVASRLAQRAASIDEAAR